MKNMKLVEEPIIETKDGEGIKETSPYFPGVGFGLGSGSGGRNGFGSGGNDYDGECNE